MDDHRLNKPTLVDRRTAALISLLDAVELRGQPPTAQTQAARDGLRAWLHQFSDEALRNLLHVLYRAAEAEARRRTCTGSSAVIGANRAGPSGGTSPA
jgi:hypothetical protein